MLKLHVCVWRGGCVAYRSTELRAFERRKSDMCRSCFDVDDSDCCDNAAMPAIDGFLLKASSQPRRWSTQCHSGRGNQSCLRIPPAAPCWIGLLLLPHKVHAVCLPNLKLSTSKAATKACIALTATCSALPWICQFPTLVQHRREHHISIEIKARVVPIEA